MNRLLMAFLCLVVASAANAEYVEVQFEGVVDAIGGSWLLDHLNDSVCAGVPFSGSFSYDTEFQELNPGNPVGSGFDVPVGDYSFEIEIGDYLFREESEYHISIANNQSIRGDGFKADMTNLVVDGPPLPPYQDEWLFSYVLFEDRTSTALDSDQLPLEFPCLEAWTHRATIGLSPGGLSELIGTVTSLTVVPEPASLALLAIGGLAVVRRR